jgi:hypothetical protein
MRQSRSVMYSWHSPFNHEKETDLDGYVVVLPEDAPVSLRPIS